MGLFKRKSPIDDETPRCPECHERVPEGAARCAMCGHVLQGDAGREGRLVAADAREKPSSLHG